MSAKSLSVTSLLLGARRAPKPPRADGARGDATLPAACLQAAAANFFVFYEIDDDESKHALSLDEYRHAEEEAINSWVLLEEA